MTTTPSKASSCLQRGEQSLPALRALKQRVAELNGYLLPPGMHLTTLYDRTDLIHLTTSTVRHIVLMGLALVTAILIIFLGDFPISLIAALTIPCSLLFAFSMMVVTGSSANLISIGAIDFGILVDASVIVLEHIYRRLEDSPAGATSGPDHRRGHGRSGTPGAVLGARDRRFAHAAVHDAGRSRKNFRAHVGDLCFRSNRRPDFRRAFRSGAGFLDSPRKRSHCSHQARAAGFSGATKSACAGALNHRGVTLSIAGACLAVAMALTLLLGGEFMPQLEEGNLWIRATLPQDVSFEIGVEDGARCPRDSAEISGGHSGRLPDGPPRRRHRRHHLQQRRVHGQPEEPRRLAFRPHQGQARRPNGRAS